MDGIAKKPQVLVIIDGMEDTQDVGIAQLSALQALRVSTDCFTPHGCSADSLTCILTLLGVPQQDLPTGRAYIELLARGGDLQAHQTALRVSAVGVDEAGCIFMLDKERGELATGRIIAQGVPLLPAQSYKSLLVADTPDAQTVIQTTAPHQNIGRKLQELLPVGLPQLASQMCALPARTGGYSFVPWSPSGKVALTPPVQLQTAYVVCGCDIMRGIALALGYDVAQVAGGTGDTDTDLQSKAACVLQSGAQTVIVHVNGADEAAHRRDGAQKRAFLQRVNDELLLPLTQSGRRLRICSDHGTSSQTGAHMSGEVRVWES